MGGGGADAGMGSTVIVNNTGGVQTLGLNSEGILAQSIGGGGGAGGFSVAGGYSADSGGLTASLGGTAGGGGASGNVTLTSGAGITISTGSDNSTAMIAQSIGGGGGDGGFSAAGGVSTKTAVNFSMGGAGGAGGNAGEVTLNNASAIFTSGTIRSASSRKAWVVEAATAGSHRGRTFDARIFAWRERGRERNERREGWHCEFDEHRDLHRTTGLQSDAIEAQSVGGGGGTEGSRQN